MYRIFHRDRLRLKRNHIFYPCNIKKRLQSDTKLLDVLLYLKESQIQFVFILNLIELYNCFGKVLIFNIGFIDLNSFYKIKNMRWCVHSRFISCLLKYRCDFYCCWSLSICSCNMNRLKCFVWMIQQLHQFGKHNCITRNWSARLTWSAKNL